MCETWCGPCYTNKKGRTNIAGHRGFKARPAMPWTPIYYQPVGEFAMKKPVESKSKKADGNPVCPDADFAKKYPTISAHLTDTRWDDGSSRERSTLTLFVEDGQMKMALNDREASRSLYVASRTLQEGLEGLEAHLAEGRAEWRAWKGRKK